MSDMKTYKVWVDDEACWGDGEPEPDVTINSKHSVDAVAERAIDILDADGLLHSNPINIIVSDGVTYTSFRYQKEWSFQEANEVSLAYLRDGGDEGSPP